MKQKANIGKTYLGLKVDADLKQRVAEAADKRDTFMTEIVIAALQEWLERNEVE